MTTMVVLHATGGTACAEQIRLGLEAQGYHVWREPRSLSLSDITYPETLENAILGSVGIILIWSSSAAQSTEVTRSISLALLLKKLIYPILLDSTALPTTLGTISPFTLQTSCTDIVAKLVPRLPAPQSTDTLITLTEKAAHNHIRVRKEAIDLAAEMLQRGEQREAVLAVLEYLTENDMMMSVREKSREVLAAEEKKTVQPSHSDEQRHTFRVRCHNGHVTNFDKRIVCAANRKVVRKGPTTEATSARKKTELDELYLQCDKCGDEIVVDVDCRGYK